MSIYRNRIVQQVRAITIMADDLSLIPKSYTMEDRTNSKLSFDFHCDMDAKIHTHTQNTLK